MQGVDTIDKFSELRFSTVEYRHVFRLMKFYLRNLSFANNFFSRKTRSGWYLMVSIAVNRISMFGRCSDYE